jgi:dihydrofolate synthase / folylpolyglutamate synthase
MNYTESVSYLLTLGRELAAPSHARATKFELTNIRALAARMENPQNKFRSIHIAGTNGKGSTAAMMESILRRAGYHTGLYTSPHLESINERIRLDGIPISDEEFAAAFTRLHALIEQMLGAGQLAAHPTFFECVTAMAFDIFARAEVEFAVLEVGLGGRLDSTNLVIPEVSVITQIHFDHESFLGHSIAEIAGEKAGIIKHGVTVVSAADNHDAIRVIRHRAEQMAAPLIEIDSTYRVSAPSSAEGFYSAEIVGTTTTTSSDAPTITLKPSLAGRYQLRNAITALAVARVLAGRGFHVSDSDIAAGIAGVSWPGRIERIQERPAVFLDGSHNPSGARELAAFWHDHLADRRIHLVYGSVRDKSVDEIAGLLFPLAASVIVTAPRQPRALSAEALAEMTRHLAPLMTVVADPRAALERAISNAEPEDVVFATGSLYLVGELRKWWNEKVGGREAGGHGGKEKD